LREKRGKPEKKPTDATSVIVYNWYPGHMAKARRMLVESLALVDVVLEIADARIPHASRNPDIVEICGARPRILVLNKADLADERQTARWAAHYAHETTVLPIVAANRKQAMQAARAMEQAAVRAIERAQGRGMKKVLRAMVVGVPNSGKSTLINAMHGGAAAQVADRAGVTRGKQWVKVSPYLELLDTPGVLWPRIDDPKAGLRLALTGSMRDDAFDVEELARALLEEISTALPDLLPRIYGVQPLPRDAFLEAICLKKGWLMTGGVPDTLRGARMTLDAFRGGKWGRITLENFESIHPTPKA